MILTVAIIGLIVLGTLCLALALLVDRKPVSREQQPKAHTKEVEGTVRAEDLEQFRRLLDEDAPHLLQHLANWRHRMDGRALQTLATRYIESSNMLARNEVLALFMGIYGLDEMVGNVDAALSRVLDKIEEIEAEREDNVTALLHEIRGKSPVQLSVWAALHDLFEVSEIKAIKMKKRVADLATAEVPTGREGIEHAMSQLLESLNALKQQLSSNLPAEREKEKGRRRKALRRSLDGLDDWARSSPGFADSVVSELPEGALVRRLTAKLWKNLNDSMKKSGGGTQEPNWPTLSGVTDALETASLGRRRSTAFVFMIIVSVLFYSLASWLIFRPSRFDVDRALLNIVQIETPDATGTGFFVSQGGWIISNYHVVKGFSKVTVKVKRRGKPAAPPQSLTADVIAYSNEEEEDVAVLRLSASEFVDDLPQGLPLERTVSFKPGQKVHVLGNPLGLQDVYTEGVISKVERDWALMDVRIGPGSSGGPVCDDRGFVVGITTAYAGMGSTNFGLGIAIPVSRVWRLINRIEQDHGKSTPSK